MNQTVYASSFLFDMGLYMPKASIIAFYWWLIPAGFRRLRIGLYIGTTYMILAGVTCLFMDALLCQPISDNWYVLKTNHTPALPLTPLAGPSRAKPTPSGTTPTR